jgi:hypothetical protein
VQRVWRIFLKRAAWCRNFGNLIFAKLFAVPIESFTAYSLQKNGFKLPASGTGRVDFLVFPAEPENQSATARSLELELGGNLITETLQLCLKLGKT